MRISKVSRYACIGRAEIKFWKTEANRRPRRRARAFELAVTSDPEFWWDNSIWWLPVSGWDLW